MKTLNTVVICLLASGTMLCQTGSRSGGVRAADGPNLPSQRMGADDLIAVSVYDAPELTRTVRVAADGTIGLPLLKGRIPAAGLFPIDLERGVAAALKAEHLLVDPVVTISIVEYRSRPVKVAGAVRMPLTFQALSGTTLLDALSLAGGVTEAAGPDIIVSIPQGHLNGGTRTIPIKALIDGASPTLNIALTGGEEVRVPEAGKVFVVGNVRRPGNYPIRDGSASSVLKLLALSEGLAPFASKNVYIYRQDGTGTKKEIAVELSRILRRKAPDVPVLANDILYVPESAGRRGLSVALEKVLVLGSGIGAAAIYTAR